MRKRYSRFCEYVFGADHDRADHGFGQVEVWDGSRKITVNNNAGIKAVAEAFGYTAEELMSIPAESNMGLSCGNPTAAAHIRPGEVVVDFGSNGALDVFLAAKMVGPEGRAIGKDMTPAMIERERAKNARRTSLPRAQEAIHQLEQAGLTTANLRSKSWDEFAVPDAPPLHFIFTVCDKAASEVCPLWPGQPMSAYWGIPHPAAVQGAPAEIERSLS